MSDLAGLIAAWRETRSVRIAELIDLVAEQGPKTDIDALCDVAKWPRKAVALNEILDTIRKLPHDPRIGMACAKAAATIVVTGARVERNAAISGLYAQAKLHGDQRVAKLLGKRIEGRQCPQETALTAAQEKLVAKIEASLAGPAKAKKAARGKLSDLLKAIYADPDDAGARSVYADALTEKGDPQGELIALQLANSDDPDARRRENALIEKLGPGLAKPFFAWFEKDHVFRGGFFGGGALRDYFTSVDDLPQWALVREIHDNKRSGAIFIQKLMLHFANAKQLKGLRVIGGARRDVASALVAGGHQKLETLEFLTQGPYDKSMKAFDACAKLPSLRSIGLLGFNDPWLAWCQKAEVVERVSRVTIEASERTKKPLGALAERGGALREIEFRDWPYTPARKSWSIVLSRASETGNWDTLTAKHAGGKLDFAALKLALAAIPATWLRTFAFSTLRTAALTKADKKALDEMLQRHKKVTR